MGLVRLTTTPLILDASDLRDHLRIDGVQDDAALAAMQRAAIDYIERQTNTQLGQGTFRTTLDSFPATRAIRIPRPPLVSVQCVKFIDAAGQEQMLDPSSYRVDTTGKPGRILLKADAAWPATATEADAVTIEFTAGHATGEEPDTIKHLIRLIVGSWFECREGVTDRRFDEIPLPFAVTTLLALHTFPEIA